MVARTWVGANGASWSTTSSWSPAGTPTTSDDCTINSSVTILFTTTSNVRNLTINGNVYLNINTRTFNVVGSLTNNSYLQSDGTTGTINFSGTTNTCNFTPGSNYLNRITIAKGTTTPFNLLGSLDCTNSTGTTVNIIYTSGTFNQNGHTVNCRIFSNSSTTTRTWNMGGGTLELYGDSTQTVYTQNTSACTFTNRGMININNSASGSCVFGLTEASAPNLRINWGNTNSVSGHVFNFEQYGINTSISYLSIWGTFDESAHDYSPSMNVSMLRSSGGTHTYSNWNRYNAVRFGAGGVACTWNIDKSQTRTLELQSTVSGMTYNLNDVEICTPDGVGNLSMYCPSATVNINYLAENAAGGTTTSIRFEPTNASTVFNINNTTTVTGNLTHTGGTIRLNSDFNFRSYSSSGTTVAKRIEFNGNWMTCSDRDATYKGGFIINDGSNWSSDANTAVDGGIRINSTSTVTLGSLISATNAPRVRIVRSLAQFGSGKVREMTVEWDCGFSASTTQSCILTVGDFVALGNISNLQNFTVRMGHQSNFDFYHYLDFGEQQFNAVTVDSSAATGISFNFTTAAIDFSADKAGVTYNFDNFKISDIMTLSPASASTFNFYQVEGVAPGGSVTQMSLGGTNCTYNFDNVVLLGGISWFGGGSTLNLNWLDVICRTFNHSGTVNKTLNANGLYFKLYNQGGSLTSSNFNDPTFLTANWGGGGIQQYGTGSLSFSTTISEASSPDRVILANTGTINGRCKILQFDGGGSTSGTVYVYDTIQGDVVNQTLGTTNIAFIGDSKNQYFTATNQGSRLQWTGDLLIQSTNSTVNLGGAGFYVDDLTMTGSNTTVKVFYDSVASVVSTAGGLTITSGYLELYANMSCGALNASGTNPRGIHFGTNNITTIRTNNTTSARVFIADASNFITTTAGGGIIHQGTGPFNHGGTNTGSINFTNGDNTMNVTITANMSGTQPTLLLPAVRNFKNHEDYMAGNFGRWTNTSTSTVYCFGNWDLYAPWYDDGTYRSKLELLYPRFSGTDPNRVHVFGSTAVIPGYPGQEPYFGTGTMASAGTLRLVNNARFGGVFKHTAGTIEFLQCDLLCTALWWEEGNSTWSSGTRTWTFPSANKYIVPSINWPHANLSFLTCSGTYYNHYDPAVLSGVYINFTAGALDSGSSNRSNTPPNYIFANGTQQLPANFYCGSIKCYTSNVPANAVIYVYGMWAPTDNGAWNTGISINMQGTGDGFIDTTGSLYSPPIEIVNPGTGTKTVYTSAMQRTTRILNITANLNTILSGLHPSGQGYPVDISGQLVLYGTLAIKANQSYTFSGSGPVLSAGTAQGYTDGGGTIYFSNSAATSANLPPNATINNITRNTTSTSTLTLTSNNTTINTIANSANGGGSFAFVNGGTGAPTFANFNIDGLVTAQTYITGPVISAGSVFTVDYANITNSAASPATKWIGGTGTVDMGGNSGWEFAAGPPPSASGNRFFLVMA